MLNFTKTKSQEISSRILNFEKKESGWIFQVLECCDNTTRSNSLFICKRYTRMLTTEASFRWRLERLHIEDGVYFPLFSTNSRTFSKGTERGSEDKETSKSLSHETGTDAGSIELSSSSHRYYKESYLIFKRKNMLWREYESNDSGVAMIADSKNDISPNNTHDEGRKSFRVSVSVRFKPLDSLLRARNKEATKSATLPLHQRLALIRYENKLVSNKDALHILKQEGEWFRDRWSSDEEGNDGIKRQAEGNQHADGESSSKQDQTPLSCGINSIDCDNNSVVVVDPTKGLRNFQFDHVMPDTCSQSSVYDKSAKPLIADFINGTNVSCLVYGVTGSGKTFTMFGPNDNIRRNKVGMSTSPTMTGIVPRACNEIFEALSFRKTSLNMKFDTSLAVSYIEIYGSQICDLLQKGKSCCSNKAASQRFVLSGTVEVPVCTVSDVIYSLEMGEKQKRKAATAMNDRSSRAHSIFIITLCQKCETTGISRTSKLFLVDLGGCEQTKKSNVNSGSSKHFERLKLETMTDNAIIGDNSERNNDEVGEILDENKNLYSTGFVQSDRMREAVYINLGLMALKNCVNALVAGRRRKYIPYAASKLTLLLSSALGGNSKTSVIVCAAQDECLVTETVAALKFGQACQKVQNSVQSKSDFLKQLIQTLDAQISKCEGDIRRKERWEVREEMRRDELAEEGTLESKGFGGVEIRKTTTLVGAEKERLFLADLLKKKASLTGTASNGGIDGKQYGGSIGFGAAHKYGMGEKNKENDPSASNYRFMDRVSKDEIPETVKMAGGEGGWKVADVVGESNILTHNERREMILRKKKSTFVYSGISA